jgi:hypothetical protein
MDIRVPLVRRSTTLLLAAFLTAAKLSMCVSINWPAGL